MAAKKKSPKDEGKVDYKDSTLHQDLTEIKLLLGCMLKDIDTIAKIEKFRSGVE